MSTAPTGGPTHDAPRRSPGRPAAAVLGVVAILLGGWLAVRPFTSLAVLLFLLLLGLAVAAASELSDLPDGPNLRHLAYARAAVYAAAALALLVWTGAGVRAALVVIGVSLVLTGLLELFQARTQAGVERWNTGLGGLASVVFGVLVLSWPDVSVIVLGVLFGLRLVLLGGRLLWRAIRPSAAQRRPWLRLVGNAAAALLALVLALVGLTLDRSAPTPDAFYRAPSSVPSEPGQLVRSEAYTREIPDDAQAWRILYTTTRDDGQPAVASGLVVVPKERAAGLPVIAWAHGTTGAAPGCAPTVIDPFEAGAFFSLDTVLSNGWAYVGTDYVGLGTAGPHPYLIGQGEGRSVLDAARAARGLTEAGLGEKTVVWGHSQGGHAALWSGILAPTYAPDLELDGVAALAPASNLPGLVQNLPNVTGGELFASYVIDSYSKVYPDVTYRQLVRPGAEPIVREMAGRCLAEKSTLVSVATALSLDKPIWNGDPDRGAFAARLRENIPDGPIEAPLLIGQGGADSLVIPAAQKAYVTARCDAGQALDYRVYDGRDHVPLVEPDSPAIPELVQWTKDRLAGAPATDSCSSL
ncbi:lipase family protein [Phycicoccus avicenniae]|uniref:lipase family protein n=1 Tax=Phycicoccus avicenniae TaxID=2828860 RepID=UPI003D2B7D8E